MPLLLLWPHTVRCGEQPVYQPRHPRQALASQSGAEVGVPSPQTGWGWGREAEGRGAEFPSPLLPAPLLPTLFNKRQLTVNVALSLLS